MYTLQDGRVVALHVGFKGTMNAMYLDTVKLQVKRAQKSRMNEGKTFALPYGYRIKCLNGREIKGEREIDRDKAKVVRGIFRLYAAGHTTVPSFRF